MSPREQGARGGESAVWPVDGRQRAPGRGAPGEAAPRRSARERRDGLGVGRHARRVGAVAGEDPAVAPQAGLRRRRAGGGAGNVLRQSLSGGAAGERQAVPIASRRESQPANPRGRTSSNVQPSSSMMRWTSAAPAGSRPWRESPALLASRSNALDDSCGEWRARDARRAIHPDERASEDETGRGQQEHGQQTQSKDQQQAV